MNFTDKNRKELLIDLIILSQIDGVGIKRIHQLIAMIGSAEKVLNSPVSLLADIPGIGREVASRIKENQDRKKAEEIADKVEKLRWDYFLFSDPDYPAPLKNIPDPPVYLFYKGNYIEADSNAMAVVGSRSASENGRVFAENIAMELAENGITIVSGMARGIDTCAHRGALKANGRTLAVFGSSLDIIYPPEGRNTAREIVGSGALFSEFLPGTIPLGPNFPRRNRIISGLAQGLIVIEAAERSGALSTANHALAQNREIFAVPGSPRSATSKGTNRLLKEGAAVLTSVDDIFEQLPRLKGDLKIGKIKREIELTESEKMIVDLFDENPIHIDILSREVSRPVPDLMPILLALELKGIVKELSGKRYILDLS